MPNFENKDEITEVSARESLEAPSSTQRFGKGEGKNDDFEVMDLRVSNDTVRAWRHGVRVANGKAFLCAPPAKAVDGNFPNAGRPLRNSDYLRIWVDELIEGGASKADGGYGMIGLPMSDQLWVIGSGDGEYVTKTDGAVTNGSDVVTLASTVNIEVGMSIREYSGGYVTTHLPSGTYVKKVLNATQIQVTRNATASGTGLTFRVGMGGNVIMKMLGPKWSGADDTGVVDLGAMLVLCRGAAAVMEAGTFNIEGAIYHDTTSKKVRHYTGAAWEDL